MRLPVSLLLALVLSISPVVGLQDPAAMTAHFIAVGQAPPFA
jgi:hypothetical protein